MRIQIILLALLFSTYIVNSVAQHMPLVYDVENTGADCPAPPLPSFSELATIESLPDPFMWSDTSRGRITSKDDWRCRRAEIGAEIQHYELGTKPAPPDTLEASFANGVLTVIVIEGGDSLTLTIPISIPDGDGPFPAVIGVGFFPTGSLPSDIFTSRGIATIHYMESQITNGWSNVRGDGPFFELYPDKKRGKFIAWAWGVSRIIDGLEKCPEANIDLSRLAVTGCSYAGKIALFSGALDERLALTIAQEPGGGGHAAWRVTETLSGSRETLGNAQGQAWYVSGLSQFNNAVTKLPYDHHELMAMVAPRALFVLGNPDYEWMAEESGHVGCKTAHEVWKALGVPDRFGFSILGGHTHCQLPNSQKPDVTAFVEKFLLGDTTANTNISKSPYKTDLSPWMTWETPELSDEPTSVGHSEKVMDRFDLLQNYPNPFNPMTTINYYLKHEDHVQLSVYDVTSKKIGTLLNQKQRAGKQTIKFDGSDLASGVYVYVLKVGQFVKSKRMLLLR
ncbi:T9SS C-terminal target domain-containing protein [candidate division KSB1 bacterium]|nr:T9SS type A sorting domain-containing protein [candidate division KSB1 bacterium]RQW05414.1 MAG: T9SS C-terminal target domain-containing protein [candidate division KSB1 bacterium]